MTSIPLLGFGGSVLFAAGVALAGCSSAPDREGEKSQAALAPLVAGPFYGAEMRSRAAFGALGRPVRVTWRVTPARSNCGITLLSLYNGDRIFGTQRGHWSEIAFEIYGGASAEPTAESFQTQLITYDRTDDSATKRGKQHAVQHVVGGDVADIWDGALHDFQIEWLPSAESDAYLAFRLDGREIRRMNGGDVVRLEPWLTAYASVWMSFHGGWGCTSDGNRAEASSATLDAIHVEELTGDVWRTVADYPFATASDVPASFDLSNWGFESFDGAYCPGNVVAQSGGTVRLELDRVCGPGLGGPWSNTP